MSNTMTQQAFDNKLTSEIAEYFFNSQQASALTKDTLGGKAFNMAWLTRNGFPVPNWYVLTTDAFKTQLRSCDLEQWIDEQVKELSAESDAIQVATVANTIQSKIDEYPLADEIKHTIASGLPKTMTEDFVAVRSSIVGEDAEGASFAGQMDSYLYQKGLDAIYDSVMGVLKSAFNQRALMYRLQKGLPIRDIQAAVIIQEMIDGEVSGVMFTAHPITGSRKHCLISGAWGCGEGIVSGICNTDEFSIHLEKDEIESQINEKDLALVFDQESGLNTKEITVEATKQTQACLTNSSLLKLKSIGKDIAERYQSPQDIEWTFVNDTFYILQTRPITSLPEISNPNDKQVVWDNSNIQESYCGVTTPLTFSFANKAYATVYEQTLRLLGVNEQELKNHQNMLDNMLGLINGRVFYNINNWYRGLLFLPSFSENKADMERMMGLEDPVDMISDRTLTGAEKLKRLPQVFKALYQLLKGFRNMDRLVLEFRQSFQDIYKSINRNQLHTYSVGELIELSRDLDKRLLEEWTTPIINDFYVMMMNGKVHRALSKAGIENVEVLQNNLMSGEEGIESTEPTKMLLSMCDDIRKNSSLKVLIEDTANEVLLDVLQSSNPNFYQRCMEYIELYGDRTMGELKLESITLRQDASFMFAILKNFLSREDLSLQTLAENEARFRQESEEEAFTAITKQSGRRALGKFKKDLNKLRDAVKNRENMRLARTRMFGLYRDIYLEIGNQLQLSGLLQDARDIFYLTVEEMYAYYDGRSVTTKFKPLVAIRKDEFEQYHADDLPHHFWTHGPVYLHNTFEYPHSAPETEIDDDSILKGTGCYPGIVEKQIRLIFSPEDELSVNGDILCTVRTDPGWAPLFPTAGGIVVERGSTLSHSAVVARELGIPAIVGVPGLTSILRDRQTIKMDGSTGEIKRLD